MPFDERDQELRLKALEDIDSTAGRLYDMSDMELPPQQLPPEEMDSNPIMMRNVPKEELPMVEPEEVKPEVQAPVKPKIDPQQFAEETKEMSPIEKAQHLKMLMSGVSQIQKGIEKYGTASAGGGLGIIKPDQQVGQATEAFGAEQLKFAQEGEERKRKDIESELTKSKLNREKILNDPASDISKKYQMLAKSRFGKQMPEMDWSNLSAKDIDSIFQRMGQFGKEQSEVDQMLKEARAKYYGTKAEYVPKEYQRKLDEDEERDRLSYQREIKRETKWKDAQDVLSAKSDLDRILEDAYKKGGPSVSALGARLAKAMGERGVLTDQDVVRYVSRPAWLDKGVDAMKKGTMGKISRGQYQDIKRMLGEMEKGANIKMQDAEDKVITQYMKSRTGREKGLEYKDASEVLGFKGKQQAQVNEVKRKTKDGKVAIFDAETKKFLRYE